MSRRKKKKALRRDRDRLAVELVRYGIKTSWQSIRGEVDPRIGIALFTARAAAIKAELDDLPYKHRLKKRPFRIGGIVPNRSMLEESGIVPQEALEKLMPSIDRNAKDSDVKIIVSCPSRVGGAE